MTLAALGVVYGDIGTSPLYAVKETFNPRNGIPLTVETILGGISVIFWSLMVVVSLKYVTLIMRAHNKGEGGIMALLGFGSSSAMASAYGVAVTGTMLVTTLLTFVVIRYHWGYNLPLCIVVTGAFVAVDIAFFSSSLLKIVQGGWFPLLLGFGVIMLMLTWQRGREMLYQQLSTSGIPLRVFLESLLQRPPQRVPGTSVFLTATPDAVPHALLHNLKHNRVLHERVVCLTVIIKEVPWVSFSERVVIESLGHDCWQVILNFGFKNRPDVTQSLTELCPAQGLDFDMLQASFFLSHETVIPVAHKDSGMAMWRERLFATMAKNAGSVVEYFNIPTNRVIELGTQVEI